MHVQLDNTKQNFPQNLSAPKTIVADFGEDFTGKRSTLFLPTFEDFVSISVIS